MKRIAILLHGMVQNDYRVIKTVKSLVAWCRVDIFYIGKKLKPEELFDVAQNICLFPVAARQGPAQKVLAHSLFWRQYDFLADAVLQTGNSYDYIWANDLPTLQPAAMLAKRFKAQLIYDAHEIYTETLNQFFPRYGGGPKAAAFRSILAFMRHFGASAESRLIRQADAFFTVNQSLLDYFATHYDIPQYSRVLMNLPRVNDFALDDEQPVDFRQKFGWASGDCIIIYQGALNEGRGLFLLLDAFGYLPPHYKLVILGNGPLKLPLKTYCNSTNMQARVEFLDWVQIVELPRYTLGADIGVNLLEAYNLSKKLASPNKLFEYIHAGIPVVASDTVENRHVFDKFPIGALCNNTPEAVAAAIRSVSGDTPVYSKALSEAKAHYCWEDQEGVLRDFFNC